MQTVLREERTIDTQRVAPFTGEGAYHGSTRARPEPRPSEARTSPPVDEVRPYTLEAYARAGRKDIALFEATFPARYEVLETLPVPSQEEIAADAVTLCWCPFETALKEAGPLTRRVLDGMSRHLTHTRRNLYVDSKIQYFRPGDLPVDSQLWHIDGSIVARDDRVRELGYAVLHDMKARLEGSAQPPLYLAYQSSLGCATQFATAPVTIELPELIGNFDELDRRVQRADPRPQPQPASSIVRFDGLSLHRARPAEQSQWRLWVRCIETDQDVRLTASIIECYNTVFQTR
jgi:hypothetical protein